MCPGLYTRHMAKNESDLGLPHEDLHSDGEDRLNKTPAQEEALQSPGNSHAVLEAWKGLL